jgi:RNA polymerase sigma-70 factor (ECF subfamily)
MAAGDEAAFRIFYEDYFDRLSRYLLVVTAGDEHATREALQTTFDRVVRHIREFTDEAVLWSWLTVLARSALRDETKKRRRYLAFLDRFTRHTDVELATKPPVDGDDRIRELLSRGMATLSADEQKLLEWKYTEQRAIREIAGELNTSEKAIESRLARTRLKLKEWILTALKHEPLA